MSATGLYQPIDDNDVQVGDIVSTEVFTKVAENLNYFIDSMPVGSIIWTVYGMPGMPAPDPRIWQACDGSEITNVNSPVLGKFTPNLTSGGIGHYLKSLSVSNGSVAGSNTKNLSHNHGGATLGWSGAPNCDEDDDFFTATDHTHTVPSDLTTINYEPAHVRLVAFYKIL